MNTSKVRIAWVGLVWIFVCMTAGCSAFAAEPPTVAWTPSPLGHSGDNATTGAIARSTRQAQATLEAQATLDRLATGTRQAQQASETAQVWVNATATIVARATRQAVIAAKADWPQQLSEPFQDNALGWPLGLTKDNSLAVISSIADGGYQWTVTVDDGNSYWNLVPKNGPVLTDFYASVTVRFVNGDAGDQTSYGLAFRTVDQDYGFFGISRSGDFRILEVHDTGIYSLYQESSEAINTQPGQVNRIAVAAVGPDFVFFINDEAVEQMSADIDPGQIGLGVDALSSADEAQMTFSDFEIFAP